VEFVLPPHQGDSLRSLTYAAQIVLADPVNCCKLLVCSRRLLGSFYGPHLLGTRTNAVKGGDPILAT
jgi:hypothetical protein